MKAIILGAGQGKRDGIDVTQHKSLQKDPVGRRALDWLIQSFENNDIHDISFVGGFQADKLIESYPHLRFYLNKEWETTNVAYSLLNAIDEFDDELIICYSDVVFHPSMIKELLQQNEDAVIVTRRLSADRFQGKSGDIIRKIEKVQTNGRRVTEIGKRLNLLKEENNEFVGVLKLTKQGTLNFKKILKESLSHSNKEVFQEAENFQQAYLTDLLQESIDRGQTIHIMQTKDAWMELDFERNLSDFVFGTKAETLERLQPKLQSAEILDQIRIEVRDWAEQPDYYIALIQQKFPNQKIVVRSSTFAEDSSTESFAGAFDSVLNIDTENRSKVCKAIEQVIQSYKDYEVEEIEKNQILIQSHLQDVAMSGVVMTRDLITGAPYYIVNYDDQTDLTDTITSGTANLKSLVCLRSAIDEVTEPALHSLLQSVSEIEKIIQSTTLDIEFAINGSGGVYIFQVRPITTLHNKELLSGAELGLILSEEADRFEQLRHRQSASLYGDVSIYANMPDWNPAEIIGVRPKPLAYTLYKYLIMDNTWRQSRQEVGYHSPDPEVLLVQFAGQPYVDARVSFNTMVPRTISKDTAQQLLNFYMKKLEQNPHLHDKVEFEILFTNYDFSVNERLQELLENEFTVEQVEEIRQALITLTNNIILGKVAPIEQQNERLLELERRRAYLIRNNKPSLYSIRTLLEDCIPYGTLPFSNLARYAFVSVSILKSLVQNEIITEEQYNRYLRSIETVASNTIVDLQKVNTQQITKEQFLKVYGHLRPGTYDITSPRYDEAFEQYFSVEESKETLEQDDLMEKYTDIFDSKTLKTIDGMLAKHGLLFNSATLFIFMEQSIVGRESSKFEFSKNLSLALQMIGELGQQKGIDLEDIQYLTIHDLLECETMDDTYLMQIIELNKKRFYYTELIKLPSVITNRDELKVFIHAENRPNYITQKSVTAEVLHVKQPVDDETLYEGKIIIIENADPGYDWVFSYPIAGLITKYGGANSHMAIRCAEFNLPAAIGCGDIIYDKVTQSNKIMLHCGEERIETI